MPRAADNQTNFTAGEIAPRLFGRVDIGKYKNGCELLENGTVLTQGGIYRRSGNRFVLEVKDSSKLTRVKDFEFSTEQAYVIEIGNLYFRFYKNRGRISSAKAISGAANNGSGLIRITATAHGFQTGNTVTVASVAGTTEANGTWVITVIGANTFDLVGSSFSNSYSSGGTATAIVEISTPYTEAQLADLRFTQSADVLYIVHKSHEPMKLIRTSHTAWSLDEIAFQDGPYYDVNLETTTLGLSGTSGSVTVTASAIVGINNGVGFASTDVGRSIRFKDAANNWTWLKITAFTDTTHVTATISGPNASATTATTNWMLGSWSNTTGFPSLVTFHEERLCFFGTTDQPQTGWHSRSGDYENMAPTDADGTVAADHALNYTLSTDQQNAIVWVSSGRKLALGTSGGEFTIAASSNADSLTPSDIQVFRETTHGSSFLDAVRTGPAVLFVTRQRKQVREFVYKFDVDQFEAPQMTLLAEHIAQKKIKEVAHMKEPNSIYWCVLDDGQLVAMTYERAQEVVGWHRHPIGGSFQDDAFAHCESLAIIPGDEQDELWTVVKRTINGATKRYIEFMEDEFRPENVNDKDFAFFVDSGLTLDNKLIITAATKATPCVVTSASHGLSNGDNIRITDVIGMTQLNKQSYKVAGVTTNTFQLTDIDSGSNVNSTSFGTYISGGFARELVTAISGLSHLEGQTVQVLGDGAVQSSKTVSSGAITIDRAASVVSVGLQYKTRLRTLRPDSGSQDGSAQAKPKRIFETAIHFLDTLGANFGSDPDDLDQIEFRGGSDPMDASPPLFSGYKIEEFTGDWEDDGRMYIEQDQPLPMTVLNVVRRMLVSDG